MAILKMKALGEVERTLDSATVATLRRVQSLGFYVHVAEGRHIICAKSKESGKPIWIEGDDIPSVAPTLCSNDYRGSPSSVAHPSAIPIEPTSKPHQRRADPVDAMGLAVEHAQSHQIPNPFNRGIHYYFIEALKILGSNEAHEFSAVRDQIRRLMSAVVPKGADQTTDWERFAFKPGVALDSNGRIMLQAEQLQRVKDAGRKLLEVGQEVLGSQGVVVDILRDEHGSPLYRLNTDSAHPVNEFRRKRPR